MKTAVSIPDEVFKEAERQARRQKISRSRLYSRALAEYLSRHAPDAVTESWNRALSEIDERLDPFVRTAARRALRRVEW
jgi:metal-responsive CopG/Arc/MetJ family transcriptional regulator